MLALGGVLAAAPLGLAAAPHASHAALRAIPLAILERPIAKRSGIGRAHESVSTKSAEAQGWYDEGLAHLHSFAWLDAARAFRMALRADPALAMAQVGMSYAFGGLGSFQGAIDAVQRAQALEAGAGARDRIRIDLRRRQLEALARADNLALSRGYVAALDRALATYPNDVEILLLRGDAASAAGSVSGMTSDANAVPYFDRARRAAPDAFAPHHYLAHAYENSDQVTLALQASQVYVKMAPNVPHAHHMLAHSLRRTGRAREAITEFEKAAALAKANLEADQIPAEYDWHTHHNTALLAAAYRYVGRYRSAEALLKPAFASAAPLVPEELNKRDWPALLLARGASADALLASTQLARHADPLVRAAGHLSAAHVLMAAGRLPEAGREADSALTALRAGGPAASELAPELRLAQGEFLLRTGDRERGRSMIRQGVASLRARPGPDAWGQALFTIEAIGRAARQAGDLELAAEMAEQLRLHDPNYAGTSFALALGAEQRGDRAGANRGFSEAIQRWRDADADHPDLVEARRRLGAQTPASAGSNPSQR